MASQGYAGGMSVADMPTSSRATFIMRAYAHLFGAMIAFTLIEVFLFKSGLAEPIAQAIFGTSWLLIIGAFALATWGTSQLAHRAESMVAQYSALLGTVLAWALIFCPLLWIADRFAEGVIASAAVVTLIGFAMLTAIVFVTRKDFSFLRGVLFWGGCVALLLIVGAVVFGFQLGMFFSVAMIAIAGASILYNTSNILHHYPEDRFVGASVELFGSIALLFWYVIQLLAFRD